MRVLRFVRIAVAGAYMVLLCCACMADCAIGTDLLAANCYYAVNNMHCDTGAHQVGLQHAFNDGQCTYDVHFPCGTAAFKPLSLCGCDGDYLCLACSRIQFDIRGHFGTVAVYGHQEQPPWTATDEWEEG